jgi:hypothetical protein
LGDKRYSRAVRVNHKNARIPSPSKELLLELAEGIHCTVAGMATVDMGEPHEPFESLPENIKRYWLEGAKSAFAIIAVHGGGQVENIQSAE